MIKESNIKIVSNTMSAEAALQSIGEVLEAAGSATPQYTKNMIQSYHDLGPYFVIAPGIALAHAKPDESVLANDVALIVCQEPVIFNSHNDPVTLLFGLCATSGNNHMENIMELANLLSDEEKIQRLHEAISPKEIESVLQEEADRKD